MARLSLVFNTAFAIVVQKAFKLVEEDSTTGNAKFKKVHKANGPTTNSPTFSGRHF